MESASYKMSKIDIYKWLETRAIVTDNDCWEWQGAVLGKGYGKLKINGRFWLAHRYVYTEIVGPIPEGHVIRHRCHNMLCVNPDHLQTGTALENVLDQMDRGTFKPRHGTCHPAEFYRRKHGFI